MLFMNHEMNSWNVIFAKFYYRVSWSYSRIGYWHHHVVCLSVRLSICEFFDTNK